VTGVYAGAVFSRRPPMASSCGGLEGRRGGRARGVRRPVGAVSCGGPAAGLDRERPGGDLQAVAARRVATRGSLGVMTAWGMLGRAGSRGECPAGATRGPLRAAAEPGARARPWTLPRPAAAPSWRDTPRGGTHRELVGRRVRISRAVRDEKLSIHPRPGVECRVARFAGQRRLAACACFPAPPDNRLWPVTPARRPRRPAPPASACRTARPVASAEVPGRCRARPRAPRPAGATHRPAHAPPRDTPPLPPLTTAGPTPV
jgi:hypothetical protein